MAAAGKPLKVLLFGAAPALVAAAILTASVSASPQPTGTPGAFRIDTTGALVQTDPGVSYITTAWQFEYATCAKLVNYPDAPSPDQSRLRPEIATGMPTISQDGRTYTFQIRDDFEFSPPATGFVTAQSMKYTFERTLSPELVSPGEQFFHNIAGEVEYHNGQANEITGIVAQGDTLTIHLIEPQGDFLTFLAMPFTCAVPIGLPHTEQIAPIPSAGPYYISSWDDPTQRLSISSNPNYHGSRPRRFDSFEYYFNQNADTIKQRVLSGATDWGDGGYWEDLAPDYGPDSPAAQQGLQQWFVVPSNCDGWIPMNTERSLFSDPNMRKAVNYAIDRTVLASMTLPYAASPTDQYLAARRPGLRGHRRVSHAPGPRPGT
jgi:peptide/nickel transport system substrate-binding protein